MKLNSDQLKALIMPVAMLTVLGIAILVAANIILSRISDTTSQIETLQTQSQSLAQKIEVLKQVDATIQSNAATVALPSFNPATLLLAQLRKTAEESVVTLGQLEVFAANAPADAMPSITFEFEATGSPASLSSFLLKLQNIAPLVNITQLEINGSSEVASLDASLSSFWSEIPNTLPAVTDATSELSAAQMQTLNTISALNLPEFAEPQAAEPTVVERETPFEVQTTIEE